MVPESQYSVLGQTASRMAVLPRFCEHQQRQVSQDARRRRMSSDGLRREMLNWNTVFVQRN